MDTYTQAILVVLMFMKMQKTSVDIHANAGSMDTIDS